MNFAVGAKNCKHLDRVLLGNGDVLERCKLRLKLDCNNCDRREHSIVEELTETVKAVIKNPKLAHAKTKRIRWVACKKCKHYKNGRCKICKCFLELKISLLASKCPKGDW